MNGISKCDYADGSHYYGHLVNNSQQGKGWKWNPVTFRSTKGEFHDNKVHGYGHDKLTTPTGEKFRWEGTFRGDMWHGLGIKTNESTGQRVHCIAEGELHLMAQPIELNDAQVQAIKSGQLNWKTLFRSQNSHAYLVETPVPFQAPYDVDTEIEAIYKHAKSYPADFDV